MKRRIILGVVLCWFATLAQAASSAEIETLLQQGQAQQALRLVERELRRDPDSVSNQFLKARALTALGKTSDAESLYRQIIQQQPQLAEAYNNLAALLILRGQLDQASELLEAALKNTHPVYATLYENLQAVNVEIARASYGQALRVEVAERQIELPQLALQEIAPAASLASAEPAGASRPEVDKAPDPIPAREPVLEPGRVALAPAETVGAAQAVMPEVAPPQPPAPAAPAAIAVEPVLSMETVDTPAVAEVFPAISLESVDDDVRATVEAWASAWAAQDVDLYLSFYADSFTPGGGLTLSAWQSQRRSRLRAPEWIQVLLDNIEVTENSGQRAVVRFLQNYQSNTYSGRTYKQLVLTHTSAGWRINKEANL